jgi:hypothetical protein
MLLAAFAIVAAALMASRPDQNLFAVEPLVAHYCIPNCLALTKLADDDRSETTMNDAVASRKARKRAA